jgi:hypothetical protein
MRTDLARARPPVARKRPFVKVTPIITRFAYWCQYKIFGLPMKTNGAPPRGS